MRDFELFSQRRRGRRGKRIIFGVYLMLKNYKKYKDINLPWLKSIPSHWDIKRAKGIFIPINERSQSGKEELLSVSSKHGVIKRENANVTMFMAGSYENYKLCWVNDLVINSLWAWQTGLGFSPYHGIISTAYSVFRLNKSDKNCRYLNYLLRGTDYQWEFQVRSKGIWRSRYQLSDNSFLDSPVILPPLSEQDQIVQYLDWKVSLINKYISAKRKQIELLKEQKQAIINQVVTKGLNPKIPMKDSGIEWLGKIPKHWEVRSLKNCCFMKSGINLTSHEITDEGKYPVYGGNGIRGFFNKYNRAGDFLLIGRQGALCGNVHKISGKFWATEHAVVVKVNDFVNIDWYYYMLIFMNLNQYSESAAQPGISVQKIQNLKTCFPPLAEQIEISGYLNKITNKIETKIKNNEDSISLLQEYCTRIISDVVTGKVDVQGIKVPEVAVENEDLPDIEQNSRKNNYKIFEVI